MKYNSTTRTDPVRLKIQPPMSLKIAKAAENYSMQKLLMWL